MKLTNPARWQQAWAALGAQGGAALHAELLARYAEPHRAYHTQQHLAECLALFDEVRQLAQQPAEIEIALWFHDAIYDVHRHDNEALSADWARTALLDAGAPLDVAGRVSALVLATRHSAAPATPDEQLLVDIDLAILGAAPARFAEYEAQIRVEYGHVPPALFNEKRGQILAGFLARSVIYGTAALQVRYEASSAAQSGPGHRRPERLNQAAARRALPPAADGVSSRYSSGPNEPAASVISA